MGANGIVVHDNPNTGQIILHRSGHGMGHHHEAAVAADVNAGGLRPGQLGTQDADHTKAHGRESACCEMGVGNLGGPILLHPRLVVAHVGEHNGVFGGYLADVGDQTAGSMGSASL